MKQNSVKQHLKLLVSRTIIHALSGKRHNQHKPGHTIHVIKQGEKGCHPVKLMQSENDFIKKGFHNLPGLKDYIIC